MKYIIDVPASFVDITNGLHIPIDKQGNLRIDTGLKLTPYTEPDLNITKDNPVHLCESCNRMQSLVSCPSKDEDSLFGEDGKSICCCKYYVPETTDCKAIEDAQNQGWKFANDIINGLNIYERRECFGYGLLPDILNSMSYQEAVDHFETWKTERNDLIKVGDEVVYSSNLYNYDVKGVVLSPETDDEYAVILTSDNFRRIVAANTELKKTGRHFSQVTDLLKEMKGECDEVSD